MTTLRQRMTEDMQIRNLAVNTQASYMLQVSQFARYFNKSPELLGPEEIRAYQIYLTNERKLATGSILVAIAALRFLYNVTLKKDWNFDEIIPAPKKPQTLPVVLSPEEVLQFLDCVASIKHRAILSCCYAAGLRISEAVRLTAPAIDSPRMVIRIEQGKGQKDRYVMLSPKLLEILRAWWREERPEALALSRRHSWPAYRQGGRRTKLAREPVAFPAFPNRSRPILCAMPLPSICWNLVQMSAPSNYCSAIAAWRPRPAICASPPAKCAPPPARSTCFLCP